MQTNLQTVKDYLMTLQDTICQGLLTEETHAQFKEDNWERAAGGGGRTRILTQGKLFEQAGVNFSHVYGDNLPTAATNARPELADRRFHAVGVSLVIHPNNPYIPTTHANFRFFLAEKDNEAPIWWFGGGFDLTPYYGFKADCQHWHQTAKAACDLTDPTLYPRFKAWCDSYFYLPHRQEARGIGGLFFDDLNDGGFTKNFTFVKNVSAAFLPAYLPLVARRKNHAFGDKEKAFQCYRRGRYVEFNLVYDRGTLFGLQSNGRTESILMSLPPVVNWRYNWQPEKGSPEAQLYEEFLPQRDWLTD